MTIEHCSLGGCAAWSADACTFLILFRTFFLCVYICNVYLVHAMGGHIVQDLEELPQRVAGTYVYVGGFYPLPLPCGLTGLCSLHFYLVFLSCLTVSPYRCFYLHILFDGYPCNKRGVVSESVLRSRHSLKLNQILTTFNVDCARASVRRLRILFYPTLHPFVARMLLSWNGLLLLTRWPLHLCHLWPFSELTNFILFLFHKMLWECRSLDCCGRQNPQASY